MIEERLNIYHSLIVGKVPLILSLQDREEFSPTYGCFDRTYWQWKFIDFPDARLQEALFTLSYIYSNNFKGNIYYRNEKILKWIKAGFLFWAKIQHRDGSFDEAYPYERSFVATGFTLFYLTEAHFLISKYFDKEIQNKILSSFRKAGDWLVKNNETHAFISNHKLGTSAALFNLSKILQEKKYEDRCWNIWRSVKKRQSVDGWFSEYGGADIGYLTQAIYYASVLYKRSLNPEIIVSLGRALDFIKYFIHPNGTIGGEYGSRNTGFYFPGGFEILAKYIPVAEAICKKLISSVTENKIPCIGTVDVYNMVPILNSVVSGCLFYFSDSTTNNEKELLPCLTKSDFVKNFDDFKILVKKIGKLYIIIGITKGGVLKVYDTEKNILINSSVGIFGKIRGKVITSQSIHRHGLEIKINNDMVIIKGDLIFANYSLLSPPKMIILRLLSLLNSRIPILSKYLKKFIVNTLILKNQPVGARFKRIIYLDPKDNIRVITDTIGISSSLFKEMEIHSSFHMGSSKYYKISDIF